MRIAALAALALVFSGAAFAKPAPTQTQVITPSSTSTSTSAGVGESGSALGSPTGSNSSSQAQLMNATPQMQETQMSFNLQNLQLQDQKHGGHHHRPPGPTNRPLRTATTATPH